MPNIQETPTYPEGVYEIQVTDFATGGPDGTANKQAIDLANRTAYLKNLIDAGHKALDGKHQLTDDDFTVNAAIDETKIALAAPTQTLKDAIDAAQQRVTGMTDQDASTKALLDRQTMFGDYLNGLNKIDDEKFFFEFFDTPFANHTQVITTNVKTVAGDESIDVASSAQLVVGGEYVIENTGVRVPVVISEILSSTRVRATTDIEVSTTGATMSKITADLHTGYADFQPGDVYIGDSVDLIDSGENKRLMLRRKDNHARIHLYFKDENTSVWTPAVKESQKASKGVPTYRDEIYLVGQGNQLQIKIEADVANPVSARVLMYVIYSLPIFEKSDDVQAPVNVSPAQGDVSVMDTPTLVGGPFRSLFNLGHVGSEFQISQSMKFDTLVYEGSEAGAVTEHIVTSGVIQVDSIYYWRCRYQDTEGNWSPWSEPTTFSTGSTFEYVAQPTAVTPLDGAEEIGASPVLTASPFTVVNTTDTHASSQWQLATDSAFTDIIWDTGTDTTNLESVSLDGAGLDTLTQYYWRVRYNGTVLGWSAWSVGAGFVTKQAFANVAGVALLQAGGDGGTWAYIDDDGNTVADPGTSFFNSHQVWGGIQDVTIDGQAMVKIPKFYIRRATISSGANTGKEAWWISDQPVDGYVVHPAFKVSGSEVDQIYIGKYQASMTGAKLDSKAGVQPTVSRSLTQFIADAQSRNVGGVSGFMLWSVYHWSAIQWLYLVENATMDSQAKTGQGRVNASSAANVDASDVAQATYRGIVGLWGNVYQWMDGLKTAGGSIHMWDREGNKSWVNTGKRRTAAAENIYPTTFMDHSAANYDFADVFIGDTGPTSNSNATAPDQQYFSEDTEHFPIVGGYWSYGAPAGLWFVHCRLAASYSSTNVGARLAKV